MTIEIFNNYGDIIFEFEKIISDIKESFIKFEKTNAAELCIILINNAEINNLNREYRNIDKPTDVLSFDGDGYYLGDIFISIDKVYEQADSYNHSIEREFAFLLCHGMLHLVGYDHQTEEEEKKMMEKAEQILESANYTR